MLEEGIHGVGLIASKLSGTIGISISFESSSEGEGDDQKPVGKDFEKGHGVRTPERVLSTEGTQSPRSHFGNAGCGWGGRVPRGRSEISFAEIERVTRSGVGCGSPSEGLPYWDKALNDPPPVYIWTEIIIIKQ